MQLRLPALRLNELKLLQELRLDDVMRMLQPWKPGRQLRLRGLRLHELHLRLHELRLLQQLRQNELRTKKMRPVELTTSASMRGCLQGVSKKGQMHDSPEH